MFWDLSASSVSYYELFALGKAMCCTSTASSPRNQVKLQGFRLKVHDLYFHNFGNRPSTLSSIVRLFMPQRQIQNWSKLPLYGALSLKNIGWQADERTHRVVTVVTRKLIELHCVTFDTNCNISTLMDISLLLGFLAIGRTSFFPGACQRENHWKVSWMNHIAEFV